VLGDLGGDFIEPSQNCINPLFADPSSEESGGVKIHLDRGIFGGGDNQALEKPNIILTNKKKKTASVALSDCLACSGCVTSAETVLLEQQSCETFLGATNSKDYDKVFLTISPQSCASLSSHYGISVEEFIPLFTDYFKTKYGVHYVFDSSFSGDVALLEMREEFVKRFEQRRIDKADKNDVDSVKPKKMKKTTWPDAPRPSIAVSSTRIKYPDEADALPTEAVLPVVTSTLPMLTSACPGVVCYFEKTKPQVLPYLSSTKSPQQIMGSVLKSFISKKIIVPPSKIYHVCVMPCPDKKLERARKDFYDENESSYDVDCVLTTAEVLTLLPEDLVEETKKPPVVEAQASPMFAPMLLGSKNSHSCSLAGQSLLGVSESRTGSGGYLEHIFRYAALTLYGVDFSGHALEYVQGRNKDFQSVTLKVDGQVKLRFAQAYGFRNIQTVVRQLKQGRCKYDFIEIMACPSGCLNGGGQIMVEGGDVMAQREKLSKVQANFRRMSSNFAYETVFSDWLGTPPLSENALANIHTRYHNVPELVNKIQASW